MDIKLKNKYIYIAAFVISVCLLSASLFYIMFDFSNRDVLLNNSYFASNYFKTELKNYADNVIILDSSFSNYEKTGPGRKSLSKLMDDLLNNKRQEFVDIVKNYETQYENTINEFGYGTQYKIEVMDNWQIYRIVSGLNYEIHDKSITYEDCYYLLIKNYLKDRGILKYYVKNLNTGDIYSNIENVSSINDYIKKSGLFSISFPNGYSSDIYQLINNKFTLNNLKGYFIVTKNLSSAPQLYKKYREFNFQRISMIFAIIAFFASCIMIFIIWRSKGIEISRINTLKKYFNRIPFDLRLVMFILLSLCIAGNLVSVKDSLILTSFPDLNNIIAISILLVYVLYLMLNINSWIKMGKSRRELQETLKNSLIYKLLYKTRKSFDRKGTMFKVLTLVFLTMAFGFFVAAAIAGLQNDMGLFAVSVVYLLLYIVIFKSFIYNNIIYFNKIIKNVEEMGDGNLNVAIEGKKSGNLSLLVNCINNIREGYRKSLENQLKNERLKTELITNVSHDLKTPLTSIINYIDLLKKDNLPKEDLVNYIEIIEKKSQRLRVLIDDLFEVSKASSGAMELNIEEIDLVALIKQVMGEFDEKIRNSTLTFKINSDKPVIFLKLDGKRTWRVFENLIGNALKYSYPGTRVYIDIFEKGNEARVAIKNISAQEMNFKEDEILERFKRGDESRSTEGSGLGLAIAQSIVELQGGGLSIETDGDLFKVNVIFKK